MNVTFEIYFLGGPNNRQKAEVIGRDGVVPFTIKVVGVDPEQQALRQGVYEESPFGGNVYLWKGWESDVGSTGSN